MDDLKDRLDRRARSFEPPPHGFERLLDRAARRRQSRRVGTSLVAVLLVAGVGVTVWALLPLRSDLAPAGGAQQRPDVSGTYDLTDFLVDYPYGEAGGGPDKSRAGVSYVPRWRGGVYPGPAECSLVLRGATGEVVGRLTVEVDARTEGRRTPPLAVPVSSRPTSAEGSCAEGSQGAGTSVRVVYSLVDISDLADPQFEDEATGEAAKLTFQVTESEAPRGAVSCDLRVHFKDGSTEEMIGLFTSDPQAVGELRSVNLPGIAADLVDDAQLICGPLSG